MIRGTAQNPDVYFQARETVNPFYMRLPRHGAAGDGQFAEVAGRQYHLFDYMARRMPSG